jgi:hypothetical protein
MFVLIYQINRASGRTLYWNTCGWTDSRRSARRYSPSEAEPVVRRMMIDNVKAKTTLPSYK